MSCWKNKHTAMRNGSEESKRPSSHTYIPFDILGNSSLFPYLGVLALPGGAKQNRELRIALV